MKKTFLVTVLLAGSAATGVAQAETSVTLYGSLDTGYGYQNYKYDGALAAKGDITVKDSGMREGTTGGSRWGLKGAEDLSNGLRAVFVLEADLDVSSGEGKSGFMRQSFVGLSSDDWGTLTMGRQYSAGKDTFMAPDGWNLGGADQVFGAVGSDEDTRVENSFRYATPELAGFQGILLYGTNAKGGNTAIVRDEGDDVLNRQSRVSVGAAYENGPLGLGASYDRQSDAKGTGDPAVTSWQISAVYDFEIVEIGAAFGQDRHGKVGWKGHPEKATGADVFYDTRRALGEGFKSNNYHVGLNVPLGGGTLYAGWNYSTSNLDDDGGVSGLSGDMFDDMSTYQLSYMYKLSKRTSVYGYGSYAQNIGYLKDLKGTEAGVGLLHKF